ncbi:ankyrin repeat domain-containing protein [Treponema pectinovorum]|uniref:ankyrin repeat domain-containing protein n=1 Tax=Treponema pectinovorum TaxID=164 RepID=UPI0011F1A96F|nr:ankyrin repeat domain-containing protein [Treponema pectinovorum]
MFFIDKKKFISIFNAVFFSFLVFAGGRKDKIFNTIENASVKEVKSILRNNQDYVNITRGSEKETLLMAALKEDREIEVIELLLKYGADPDKKDSLKRNAVMYAAMYCSSPKVLEKTIKAGTFFGFSRKKRVLKKDAEGKTSFDYARKNSSKDEMLEVLNKFATEPIPLETSDLKENSAQISVNHNEEIPSATQIISPAEVAVTAMTQENAALTTTAVTATAPLAVLGIEQDSKENQDKNNVASEDKKTSEEFSDKNDSSSFKEEEKTLTQQIEQNLTEQIQIEKENSTANDSPIQLEENPEKNQPAPSIQSSTIKVEPFNRQYLLEFAEDANEEHDFPTESKDEVSHNFIENADKRDSNGRTKLMDAAKKGDIQLVENLIYSKVNLNAKDNDGWTALMFAARFCPDVKILRLLIKNGADENLKNDYGITALKLAAGFSKSPQVIAELLLMHSSTENEVRSSFVYAITSSAQNSTLDEFLKKGIPLNNFYDGKTPLMYAAESNRDTRIINWLLKNGAKKNYRTSSGLTAFDFAKANKNLTKDSVYWTLSPYGEE